MGKAHHNKLIECVEYYLLQQKEKNNQKKHNAHKKIQGHCKHQLLCFAVLRVAAASSPASITATLAYQHKYVMN